MAEIGENIEFIDDDGSEDSLFDDGSVVAGVVHEKSYGRLAEHASSFWERAKVGYEKGKAEGTAKFDDDVHFEDGDAIEGEGVELRNVKAGAWERLASIPDTVKGVVGFRNTGNPNPSAGVLVTEELVEVPKPRPIPELFHDATEEVAGLVHAELALVKAEIQQKIKIILPALVLLCAAVGLLLFAIPFILWAIVFAMYTLLHIPLWGASLILFVVLLIITAILAKLGLNKLKTLGGVKSLAGGSIKDDIHAIIEAFKGHKWADAQAAIKEERL